MTKIWQCFANSCKVMQSCSKGYIFQRQKMSAKILKTYARSYKVRQSFAKFGTVIPSFAKLKKIWQSYVTLCKEIHFW